MYVRAWCSGRACCRPKRSSFRLSMACHRGQTAPCRCLRLQFGQRRRRQRPGAHLARFATRARDDAWRGLPLGKYRVYTWFRIGLSARSRASFNVAGIRFGRTLFVLWFERCRFSVHIGWPICAAVKERTIRGSWQTRMLGGCLPCLSCQCEPGRIYGITSHSRRVETFFGGCHACVWTRVLLTSGAVYARGVF